MQFIAYFSGRLALAVYKVFHNFQHFLFLLFYFIMTTTTLANWPLLVVVVIFVVVAVLVVVVAVDSFINSNPFVHMIYVLYKYRNKWSSQRICKAFSCRNNHIDTPTYSHSHTHSHPLTTRV